MGTYLNVRVSRGFSILAAGLAMGGALLASSARAADAADPKDAGKATLTIVATDSFNNVLTRWAAAWTAAHPGVRVVPVARDTENAAASLAEGACAVALVDRELTAAEVARCVPARGPQLVSVPVAVEALAVFVTADNPLPGLSLKDLARVFAAAPEGGKTAATWGELGVQGRLAALPIRVFGPTPKTPPWDWFRATVLAGGAFRPDVTALPGLDGVVQSVVTEPAGIGYSFPRFAAPGVKLLPLAAAGAEAAPPEAGPVLSGKYPLGRVLRAYAVAPAEGGDRAALDFLKMVLSDPGQQAVAAEGLLPLPVAALAEARALVK